MNSEWSTRCRSRDPQNGLVVRCQAIEYHDFPTVEWTVYLRNTGQQDSPLLTDILPLDTRFERSPGAEFVLHHQTGSPCLPTDYEPFATELKPATTKRITAAGGRPTNSDLPYFNVEWLGQGLIAVVGWPGQWAAEFVRDGDRSLHLRAGQELTRFRLHPGEEVRTPLIVLQFWKGDRIRSQNVWRRWMIAHNLPRPGGQLPPVQLAACSSHQFGEMINADRASQKLFIDRYLAEGLKLDYWWMDAGWYWNKTGWPNVGTWEVDTKRFPGGLRPICDHAHAQGREDHRLVRTRTRDSGYVAVRPASRMAAGSRRRHEAPQPGQSAGPPVAHRPCGSTAHQPGDRLVSTRFQYRSAGFLAVWRARRPTGNHGDPLRGRIPGVLG